MDLDETLIHTSYAPIEGAQLISRREYFYLYERTHLKEFWNDVLRNTIWQYGRPVRRIMSVGSSVQLFFPITRLFS